MLDRSLAAAGLDPSGLVGSGQVELLDIARLHYRDVVDDLWQATVVAVELTGKKDR